MLTAWRDLIADKKFWTAKLAIITLIASKSLKVDAHALWAITAIFVSLLGAQGLAEHGRGIPVAVAASTPVVPAAPVVTAPPVTTDVGDIVGGVVSAVAGGVTAAIAGGL